MATGLSFVALTINTRALGLEMLGVLMVMQAVSEMATKFGSFQTWQGMIRFGADDLADRSPRRLRVRYRFGLMLDTGAAVLATGVAVTALLLWGDGIGLSHEHRTLGIVYALSGLVGGTGSSAGIIRLTNWFGVGTLLQVVGAAALTLNAATLAVLDAPFEAYVYTIASIMALVSGTRIAIGWFRVEQLVRQRPDDVDPEGAVDRRQFFRFAVGTSASGTLNTLRNKGEVLIVSTIAGPAAAAVFGVALRVAALLSRLAENGRQSVYPELAKLVAAGNFMEARSVAAKMTMLAAWVAVPAYAATLAYGDVGLSIGFGQEYARAYPNLIWLMTANLLYVLGFALGPLVLISYGARRYFLLNLIAFGGFIVGAVIGPVTLGTAGAGLGAAAFSCAYVPMLAYHVFYMVPARCDRVTVRAGVVDPVGSRVA